MISKKLIWDEKYSVGVELIDAQHKHMFSIINELLEKVKTDIQKGQLEEIINNLFEYKKFHFSTEEKYFEEFNYERAQEHILKHREFTEKLNKIKESYPEFNLEAAFKLIDFLEDWLIDHLIIMDQGYKKCFQEHGLK